MRTVVLTVLEVLSLLVVVYGVALVYLPAGYILAGLLGVAVAEKMLARPPTAPRKGAKQ